MSFPIAGLCLMKNEMEEERRLAYVGITRAEEELYLTNAKMRTLYGRTNFNPISRFIQEIPEELIEGIEQMRNNKFGFSFDSAGDDPYPAETESCSKTEIPRSRKGRMEAGR